MYLIICTNILAFNSKKTHWVAWKKPQSRFTKVKFDRPKSSQGALGSFIIHNWNKKFIQTSTLNLGASSILVAEAMAIWNGIKSVVQADFTNMKSKLNEIIKFSFKEFKGKFNCHGRFKFWNKTLLLTFDYAIRFSCIIFSDKKIG